MGLGAYFPKLAEAARFEQLYQPPKGYEPLRAVKFLRQVVTENSETSRLIIWQAEEEIKNLRLEYKLTDGEKIFYGEVSYENFSDDEKIFIYSCELKNLSPQSLYNFRIVSGNKATAWQNLRTTGQKNFQMLVFSDSQCADYNVWQRTADAAHKKFPAAELAAVVGDLVDNGQANYQWRAWHIAAAHLLAERIFVPVLGNHECYSLQWKNCLPEKFSQQFKLSEKNFYSFKFGAAHFFVLNNQFDELDEFFPNLSEEQISWLKNQAANSDRTWKIIFMHKDIFDYAQNNFNDIAEIFMDTFDELQIDLVLTGHLHTYRNRGKIFARKKSPSGTCYVLCGRAGDQKYIEPPSELDEATAPDISAEEESYVYLQVDENFLDVTCLSVGGEVWDKFTLRKNFVSPPE